MTHEQIIRAWKDEDYRQSMSGEELSALPAHPAGLVELSDESLGNIAGQEEEVTPTVIIVTLALCVPLTTYLITKYLCADEAA